jgi:hypothetical protein
MRVREQPKRTGYRKIVVGTKEISGTENDTVNFWINLKTPYARTNETIVQQLGVSNILLPYRMCLSDRSLPMIL